VELEEMGPRFDLTLRRNRPPPPDLAKEALRVPKTTATKVPLLFAPSRPFAHDLTTIND
jgi:hypothetical protein